MTLSTRLIFVAAAIVLALLVLLKTIDDAATALAVGLICAAVATVVP
jgi:hypothetical protein